ncbi:hypothetical protein ACQ4PT_065261 [Festuca glaucescens]
MGAVSRRWRSFNGSSEFSAVRKEVRKIEELVYVLVAEAGEKGSRWEVLGEHENKEIPPMPGLIKVGFGVVVLHGKLWGALARLNFARRDFACTKVNSIIYVAGGFGSGGNSLSSVEAYDPQKNRWTLIDNLRRPRSGCFAFGLNNKLYIMGGRSSFTIGNSRSVDVYDPRRRGWEEIKRGCVMVTSHAVVGKSLFCIEWRDQRSLSVFNPSDSSWMKISVPLTGGRWATDYDVRSSCGTRFRMGDIRAEAIGVVLVQCDQ